MHSLHILYRFLKIISSTMMSMNSLKDATNLTSQPKEFQNLLSFITKINTLTTQLYQLNLRLFSETCTKSRNSIKKVSELQNPKSKMNCSSDLVSKTKQQGWPIQNQVANSWQLYQNNSWCKTRKKLSRKTLQQISIHFQPQKILLRMSKC